mmetsp:Transcript_11546/g.35690  ORF Transcript_11546/g.35690 Transcript_11546/m.35690 type:complete len:206 (-) Transcript_11546:1251-1868(-)|eukprot:scaffold263904_cov35-Tisochrysis_lutea.AAC.3
MFQPSGAPGWPDFWLAFSSHAQPFPRTKLPRLFCATPSVRFALIICAFASDLLLADNSCQPFAHAVTVVADMGDDTVPKTYRQVLQPPHADYWRVAINMELGASSPNGWRRSEWSPPSMQAFGRPWHLPHLKRTHPPMCARNPSHGSLAGVLFHSVHGRFWLAFGWHSSLSLKASTASALDESGRMPHRNYGHVERRVFGHACTT